MIIDDISDSRMRRTTQNYIGTQQSWKNQLKGLYLCGSGIIKHTAAQSGVFVLTDGEHSKLFGNTLCHSAWACPYCTARVMARKGKRIGAAIDGLATWYKQYACMMTFTIPHRASMSCNDVFEILLKTWRYFTRNRKEKRNKVYTLQLDADKKNKSFGKDKRITSEIDKRAVGTKGEKRTSEVGHDPWGNYVEQLEIKNWIKVFEFTWGENGWHPHIHGLFWIPESKFYSCIDYEDELAERWWHCAKAQAIIYYDRKNPDQHEKNVEFVENLFADWKKHHKNGHKAVYISKDNNGEPVKQTSARYIEGWGADSETSRLEFKKAAEGHYTIQQIYEQIEKTTGEEKKHWLDLYIEYACATRTKRRFAFSNTGLNQIIDKWLASKASIEILKKNLIEHTPYRVVVWFKEKQWSTICYLERYYQIHLVPTILELARAPNGRETIIDMLLEIGVDVRDNKPHEHEHIVTSMFNQYYLQACGA